MAWGFLRGACQAPSARRSARRGGRLRLGVAPLRPRSAPTGPLGVATDDTQFARPNGRPSLDVRCAMKFRDRRDAGRALAQCLVHHRGRPDLLVLGLPRGGVPVAYEVARALGAPLDVFVVRKLGAPEHPELAMGAIAS